MEEDLEFVEETEIWRNADGNSNVVTLQELLDRRRALLNRKKQVLDQKLTDTMYTERFMGRPTEEDNLKGYEAGDVIALVDELRGKDFYIMHGNADDNVHYQNAAKLMRALQEKNIPFEQMSYPDEAHSLAGVNLHRYHAMDKYWDRCLKLA